MLTKSINIFGRNIPRFFAFNTNKNKQSDYSNTKSSNKEYLLLGGVILGGLYYTTKNKKSHAWIYRDDIGAPHGIHGYEEQVNSVGQHHGHMHWTQEQLLTAFDSAAVRRGFKVWLKSCQSCHGAYKQKYDIMVEKVFDQVELIVFLYLI